MRYVLLMFQEIIICAHSMAMQERRVCIHHLNDAPHCYRPEPMFQCVF
jgi:hypothetical protein